MSTSILRKRKAVSPVIATVILIAVAVALGIAVAFWASGLTSSFSKYEKLGVSEQYSILNPTATGSTTVSCPASGSCWEIVLGGQNTGSSDASITQIQVNGVPINPATNNGDLQWGTSSGGASCSPSSSKTSLPIPVASGSNFCLIFFLPNASGSGQSFASGQTIQVTIITAAGNNYPASIVLP